MSRFSWQKIPKPFLALAPLAGISDSPFRQICKEHGADVVFTELISAEGLARRQEKTLDLITFNEKERPIILQLFGKNPEGFARAAQVVENLPARKKPDGLDLNCGCPARKVKTHGSGITLMRDSNLVNKIIDSITKNARLPLSIKIRAGIRKEKIQANEFIQKINWQKLSAIIIHGRYLEQGFSGEIDYSEIKKIKKIVKDKIVIANGGICDLQSAKIMLQKTRADGLVIGQASFGRPWIFQEIKKGLAQDPLQLPLNKRGWIKKIALEHAKSMVKSKGEERGMREMRKYLLWYFRGFPEAKKIRKQLVTTKTLLELKSVFTKLYTNQQNHDKYNDRNG